MGRNLKPLPKTTSSSQAGKPDPNSTSVHAAKKRVSRRTPPRSSSSSPSSEQLLTEIWEGFRRIDEETRAFALPSGHRDRRSKKSQTTQRNHTASSSTRPKPSRPSQRAVYPVPTRESQQDDTDASSNSENSDSKVDDSRSDLSSISDTPLRVVHMRKDQTPPRKPYEYEEPERRIHAQIHELELSGHTIRYEPSCAFITLEVDGQAPAHIRLAARTDASRSKPSLTWKMMNAGDVPDIAVRPSSRMKLVLFDTVDSQALAIGEAEIWFEQAILPPYASHKLRMYKSEGEVQLHIRMGVEEDPASTQAIERSNTHVCDPLRPAHSGEDNVQHLLMCVEASLVGPMYLLSSQDGVSLQKNARVLLVEALKGIVSMTGEGLTVLVELHNAVAILRERGSNLRTIDNPQDIVQGILVLAIRCAVALDAKLRLGGISSAAPFALDLGHYTIRLSNDAAQLRAVNTLLRFADRFPMLLIELNISQVHRSSTMPIKVTAKMLSDVHVGFPLAATTVRIPPQSEDGNSASVWLAVRPSSRLSLEVLYDEDPPKQASHVSLSVSEIIAKLAEGNSQYTVKVPGDAANHRSIRLNIGVMVHHHSTLGDPERSHTNSHTPPTLPPSLEEEAAGIVDFAFALDYTAIRLRDFLQRCREVQGSLVASSPTDVFLSTTISTLRLVGNNLSQVANNGSPSSQNEVLAQIYSDGRSSPLRSLVQQTGVSLRILMEQDIHLSAMGSSLVGETLGEFCRITGTIEAYIDGCKITVRNMTEATRGPYSTDDACAQHQARLFSLLYRGLIKVYKDTTALSTDQQGRFEIVKNLLQLSQEENEENDTRSPNHQSLPPDVYVFRPFTEALASPRGTESNRVFEVIYELLQSSTDAIFRRFYRRILVRLVQAADMLPDVLYIPMPSALVPIQASGYYARIFRGKTAAGAEVAVKVPHALAALLSRTNDRRLLYIEIISWKTMRHPRVLPFLGLAAGTELGPLCMVSPFMRKGTLRDICGSSTDASTRIRYITEVVEGMVYLHEEGIVHGDLRGANIFVNEEDHIHIADFGLSILAEGHSKNYFSTRSGNARWLAPELLAPERYCAPDASGVPSSRPTKLSDVYTFSCLCIELYTGKAPFHERSDYAILSVVIRPAAERPTRPENMPDGVWELVQQCWDDEPTARPPFRVIEEILKSGTMENRRPHTNSKEKSSWMTHLKLWCCW